MTTGRDWRGIQDEKEKYAAYLCSHEWAVLRSAVLERAGGVCERCHSNDATHIHHKTYTRKYAEPIEDLVAWCKSCHEWNHDKSKVDPSDEPMRRLAEIKPLVIEDDPSCPGFLNENTVCCPYCGHVNCHITGVDRNKNGLSLIVHMFGECEHRWEMCFRSEKGVVSGFVRNGRIGPQENENSEDW
jgi:hypothetical protein